MKNSQAGKVALGGILAALALVVMMLGGLIPIATYVCPTICILICAVVLYTTGNRIAWAWYSAVGFLSLLLAPDKEAAAVFVFVGYYPMLKLCFERFRLGVALKLIYFNSAIFLMYFILIRFLGMEEIAKEYMELGKIGLLVFLLLGNVVFILLDRILHHYSRNMRH